MKSNKIRRKHSGKTKDCLAARNRARLNDLYGHVLPLDVLTNGSVSSEDCQNPCFSDF